MATKGVLLEAIRKLEINNMKQKYISSNNDWFSYFAIYLAYKIEYPKKCPTFD